MATPIFPLHTREHILACQFSSWYPTFAKRSLKSTIIRPLDSQFQEYLHADGVFVPEGSDDRPEDELSNDGTSEGEDEPDSFAAPPHRYSFPELDVKIRQVVKEYGGVFPKLNWTSPRDAHWILPPSYPMRCTSPADIYLLLKSSDFISHDLNPSLVFEGTEPVPPDDQPYTLELVLRKWYSIDKSREVRCFVRQGHLIAITQRDMIFYQHLNDNETQSKMKETANNFWETEIKPLWTGGSSYVVDLLLSKDLARAHIVDFNPYIARTDPLLFTYEELANLFSERSSPAVPVLRVINSPAHAMANRNAPVHQHNMVPLEAFALGWDAKTLAEIRRVDAEASAPEEAE